MEKSMFMKRVAGHDKVIKRIERLFAAGRLPHALLFYGPEGVGKEVAGLEIGKALMCKSDEKPCNACDSCRLYNNFENPDFFYIFPIEKPKKDFKGGAWESAMNDSQLEAFRSELDEKKIDPYHPVNFPKASGILIGQIKKLIQTSSLSSYLGGARFVLISSADTMNREAQNSLLKLLEEPPDGFYLCLISSRPDALLPTILSRCQPFYFPVLTNMDIEEGLMEKYDCDREKAKQISVQANGSFLRARDILKNGDPARDEALNEFLIPLVMNRPEKMFLFAKKHVNTTDKQYLKSVLIRLDHWLRDIDMMDNELNPKHNPDLGKRLNDFRKNITYEQLNILRCHILEAVDLIDKNVYIDVILTNLAVTFSKFMKLK